MKDYVQPKSLSISSKVNTGNIIIIRYFDHVLFRDVESYDLMKPIVRETIGWLESEEEEFIRVIWERFAEPSTDQSKVRSTGLALRKTDIIQITSVQQKLSSKSDPTGSLPSVRSLNRDRKTRQ
jgi:hypothetical protein